MHVARHERDAEVLPLGNVLEPQDEGVALLLVVGRARVVCQVVLEFGLSVQIIKVISCERYGMNGGRMKLTR